MLLATNVPVSRNSRRNSRPGVLSQGVAKNTLVDGDRAFGQPKRRQNATCESYIASGGEHFTEAVRRRDASLAGFGLVWLGLKLDEILYPHLFDESHLGLQPVNMLFLAL
jgi:hypothetical protein